MRSPEFPNRDWLADQLKGWAVLWMILVHSVELFLHPSYVAHPVAQFAYFMGAVPAAPVFMLLMGYYSLRQSHTFTRTILRGGKLILWGLFLNVGLNFSLLIRWITGVADVNIMQYILGVDILFLAGFAMIIAGILDLLKLRWFAWFILALMPPIVSELNLFSIADISDTLQVRWTDYLVAVFTGPAAWSYFPVIPWISYVFAGIGLYRLSRVWPDVFEKKRYQFYAALPAFLIFVAGTVPAWKICRNLELYYHHGFYFFLWAVSLIFLLALLVQANRQALGGLVGKWIRFIGVRVTSVYVIQWLIIGNLGSWFYQSFTLPVTVLLFFAILLITTFVSFMYFKIRQL